MVAFPFFLYFQYNRKLLIRLKRVKCMACKYLKLLNVEGQKVECQAPNTNKCPKSRGFFRITPTCWRFKNE